jgi:hypothetical protein
MGGRILERRLAVQRKLRSVNGKVLTFARDHEKDPMYGVLAPV